MKIDAIIERIRADVRCRLLAPVGSPTVPKSFQLPAEVLRFYERCGGLELFEKEVDRRPLYRVLPPAEVCDVCMAVVADYTYREPPLDGWFAIGSDDGSDAVVIDLNESTYGRCYDIFHETYADPFSARIVALTFEEFLERLIAGGRYWFDEHFRSYGYYGQDST